MANNDNETKQFDCSRGCSVEQNPEGGYECNYRPGCCKLQVYDWLHGVTLVDYKNLFEVRFKNTRKGIYVNTSGQSLKTGDLVIVEAATGYDLGIVTLEGAIVLHQMVTRHIDPATTEFKAIYRKARQNDIDKWREAIAREHAVMIRSRQLAARLGLEMKIGDVEFQGDGTKAIFYYIAAHRVDFRQLIKDFAEEFRIRVEMKQIGSRQEAGLIGGLGVCGRELCCSNHITAFQSISTTAARIQGLSLNPVKLAGQCGNLKCCLNYEAAVYNDAQGRIPKLHHPLEFEDGQAFLMKTDILAEKMYFSYDQNSFANLFELSASEVKNIIKQNNAGVKPQSLIVRRDRMAAQAKAAAAENDPGFITAVGDDSISRFDKTSKNKHRHKRNKNKNKGKENSNGQQG